MPSSKFCCTPPTENRCPPVPKVANAVADTTLAVQGTVVTYKCLVGFNMTEVPAEASLTCDGRYWKGNISSCEGRERVGRVVAINSFVSLE